MADSMIQVLEGLGYQMSDEVTVNGLAATESPRADPGVTPGEVFTPKLLLGIAAAAYLAWRFIGRNPRASLAGVDDLRFHFLRRKGRGDWYDAGMATVKDRRDADVIVKGKDGARKLGKKLEKYQRSKRRRAAAKRRRSR